MYIDSFLSNFKSLAFIPAAICVFVQTDLKKIPKKIVLKSCEKFYNATIIRKQLK